MRTSPTIQTGDAFSLGLLTRSKTLNDFFEGFLENLKRRGRRRGTVTNHVYLYNSIIKPIVGNVPLRKLTLVMGDDIADYGKRVAETNAIRAVVTFRQMLRYIAREGERLPFHWKDVELPHYNVRKKVEAYSDKDIKYIRKFLASQTIKTSKHTSAVAKWQYNFSMMRARAIFELSIHSGLRLSEYPGIDKKDIDWDTHEMRIVNSKTHEVERVYFNGADVAIRKYLEMRKDQNEALFVTHDGKRISRDGLKAHIRLIKQRIEEAGGFGKSFASHMSRKTFCTHLVLHSKADLKTIQRLARHKSIRTTINHYVALDERLAARVHKKAMAGW